MTGRRFKFLLDATTGALAVGLLNVIKRLDRKRTADFAGWLMRKIGPLLKEHGIGRDNLRAAFPEKSDAEITRILGGVWDNLGRISVEFAHLADFHVAGFGPPHPDDIPFPEASLERYHRILKSGRARIAFAAHLANWELFAVVVKQLGVESAVLYRRPNIRAISDLVIKLREPLMGQMIPAGLDAPLKLARLLQSGINVGMLADQHYTRGVEVMFFGRPCMVNPLPALLARQTGCPIHGVRSVRLPDGNSFGGEVTEEVEPARDAQGQIDIKGTMQAITSVIESWVREHPEQWLWVHRRWR